MEENQEEELDVGVVLKEIKKINPLVWTGLIIIALLILCYQLGFMVGYNQSYHGQKDYYETKITRYCYCQDELVQSMNYEPLIVPTLEEIKIE